jgi:uncharacterized protein YjbI with pentapeptide repeats
MESSYQRAIESGPLLIDQLKATNTVVYNLSTHTAITAQGAISYQKHALDNTSLSNLIIYNCKITKAILKSCFIVDSELRDCILDDCKLAHSSIYDSSFNNCSCSKCADQPFLISTRSHARSGTRSSPNSSNGIERLRCSLLL